MKDLKLKDGDFTSKRPFGPSMGFVKLPKKILEGLREITSEIIRDPTRESWGQNLAGVINEEPKLSEKDFIKAGANDFINKAINTYAIDSKNNYSKKNFNRDEYKTITFIREAWIVSQYENEYNPVHNHQSCEISSVIYINIPNMNNRNIKSKVNKRNPDGNINFIYSAGERDDDIFECGSINIKPIEGLMILFPSFLYHTVYPFIGEGERRSIALNASYQIVKEKSNNNYFLESGSKYGLPKANLPFKDKKD